ncbi:uncharacterized protein LOC62_05G006772 [Vanrija pseudolonga]|uniref:Uncharacterized protein n=1 Tax=Vanrija pseudolonga TaxID=143232 RepID=A0AAF1BNK1_9TREE|nr:hypothetical protein LOC62_05G006772 [Vanrija pseudolonga]
MSQGVIDLRSPTPDPLSLPPSPSVGRSRDSSFRPSPSRRSTTVPSPVRRGAPAPAAGPSQLRPAAEVIDLSLEDDDDIQPLARFVHNAEAGPARPRHPHLEAERFRNNMAEADEDDLAEIDAALARAAPAMERLGAAFGIRNDPPPAVNPPRGIGFGGAVFRRGNRELRFNPNGATRQFHINPADGVAAPPNPPADDAHMATRSTGRRLRQLHRLVDPDYEPDEADGDEMAAAAAAVGDLDRLYQRLQRPRPAPVMLGDFFQYPLGGGLMGRAPRDNDVPTILAKVVADTVPEARKGFSRTWEAEEIDADPTDKAIRVDDHGRVIPPTPKKNRKPYLSCAHCVNALRVSSAQRDPKDHVWALRCGHLIDQQCLHELCAAAAEGNGDAAASDEPAAKRQRHSPRKSKRKTAARPPPPAEHSWLCPVADCKRVHVAQLVDGQWTQKQGVGAIQIYV